MIYGLGCDIVTISRFAGWESYTREKLAKVFTEQEIAEYAQLTTTQAKVEFLASRFAVKEAFYKALCQYMTSQGQEKMPAFAQVRTLVQVQKTVSGVPILDINWEALRTVFPGMPDNLQAQCSLSHETEYAMAMVVIDSN